MTDDEISDGPPGGLFFAGSDDDKDDIIIERPDSPAATVSGRGSSPPSLFLPDSDDEQIPEDIPISPFLNKRKLVLPDDDYVIELPSPGPSQRRAPSVQRLDSVEIRSVSPTPKSKKPDPPTKKRRISPKVITPTFPPTYLGEVLVPNAWSNVSGKGYIKCNDIVRIHRDDQGDNDNPGPSKTGVTKAKKKGDGKKQMSLTAMLKPQPAKINKKKKGDNIVRLLNTRGIGKLLRLVIQHVY